MPIYEFQCNSCKHVSEQIFKIHECPESITCPSCGSTSSKIISKPNRDWFRPFWHEDLDIKPIYIESKKQLKRICKEKGFYAKCLD